MAGFVDKFGDMAKKAADKTGDLVEVGRLNAKIMSQKQNIATLKERMGGALYQKYQQGEALSEELSELCQQIVETEKAIRRMQQEIQELKNN